MIRSKRVLALYAELSGGVGDEFTPRVLMACAETLDELVNGSANMPEYSLRQGGLSLEACGVDRVLHDASWALAANGLWEDDPSADCADTIHTRSMFASIERGLLF
jgi:hypothetical protein